MKKRRFLFVVLLVAMVSLAVAACKPPVTELKEGPETGVYYNDSAGYENLLTLSNGDKFLFWFQDENKSGTYTLSGEVLTLTFNKEEGNTEQEKLTASLSNEVITLTYSGADMRFLKKKTLTVSFDSKGGSAVASVPVMVGKTISKPADPTRAGYIFIGWYTDNTFTTEFKFDSLAITENITLHAYWVPEAPGITEYTIGFDLNYQGAPEVSYIETIGGKLYNVPTPENRSGFDFKGWWISMDDDGSKLSYPLAANTVFNENTTLYALWQSTASTGAKLAAPIVRVDGDAVRWEGVQGAISYKLQVNGPTGFTAIDESVGSVFKVVPFSTSPAGDYVIKVTATASNQTNNSDITEIHFRNKALARVSHFTVIEPSVLVFNKVENATNYLLTIDCGDEQHNQGHTALNLGDNNIYNFASCGMPKGGIKFVVTAQADGYASSESIEYVFDRILPEIDVFFMDEATQTLWWNGVPGATNYMVTVECTNASHNHVNDNGNKTSYSLKECAMGDVKVSVYPAARGYNSPDASEYTYKKTNIASPGSIYLDGNTIRWASVDGATSYVIRMAGQDFVSDTNSFAKPDSIEFEIGKDNEVFIKAVGATESLWSDAFIINLDITGVTYNQNTVTWSYVFGAEKYQVRLNGGTPVEVTANTLKITLNRAGSNTIEVRLFNGSDYSAWVGINVNAFTITLESGEGEDVGPLFRANGDETALPDSTRTGYEFAGWYLSNESGAVRYTDTIYERNSDLTLYARWTARTYTATYDYQGKDGEEINQTVTFGQHFKFDVPENNTEDGTSFVGWYSAPNGGGIRYTDELGNSINPWIATDDVTVYAYWGDVLRYILLAEDETYSVVKGLDADLVSTIIIPARYNGENVTRIESFAFLSSVRLTSILIPNSIKNIDSTAFYRCNNLLNIEIYSVEGNRDIEFVTEGGVLYKVIAKDNEGVIEELELFHYPMAKSDDYTIPQKVTSIGQEVFSGRTGLTSITIPAAVKEIGIAAFKNCTGLVTVVFQGGSQLAQIRPDAFYGCSSLLTMTIPAGVVNIGNTAFRNCVNLIDLYISNTVESIGNYAFAGCRSLANVVFQKGGQNALIFGQQDLEQTSTIFTYVFQNCVSLIVLEIPNRTSIIGNYAFAGCSNLRDLTFEPSNDNRELRIGTSVAGGATNTSVFLNCVGLRSLEIPARTAFIGSYAFSGCRNFDNITFEYGGTSLTIGNYAFRECTITEIEIPKTVTVLDFNLVFAGCSILNSITVEAGHTTFTIIDGLVCSSDESEIIYCPRGRTGTYDIPDSVTKINEYAFSDCVLLEGIFIPNTVKEIESYAFYGCSNLINVDFEPGETEDLIFRSNSFGLCSRITSIIIPARTTLLGAYTFQECHSLRTVTFEEPSSEETSRGLKLGIVASNIQSTYLFQNCYSLGDISFPERLVAESSTIGAIPNHTFYGSGVTKIYIPKSVTSIGPQAFHTTSSLAKFDVHEENSVYYIDNEDGVLLGKIYNIFTGVTYKTLIAFPEAKSTTYTTHDEITMINNFAFYNNNTITSVHFHKDMINTGTSAFVNAKNLRSVTFEDGGTESLSINNSCFESTINLESIIIPARTGSLGSSVFRYSGIKTINFKKEAFEEGGEQITKLATIAQNCFSDSGLTSIVIPKTVKTIGYSSFAFCKYLTTVEYETGNTLLALVEYDMFKTCPVLEEVINIPAGVKTLGRSATNSSVFINATSLVSVTFETGSILEIIGASAFENSVIASFDIPSSVKTIGNKAFLGSGLTGNISIPAAVTSIGTNAFQNCTALTGVTFEKAVFVENGEPVSKLVTIDNYAFNNTGIETITIPKSVTKIGNYAFAGCLELTTAGFEAGCVLSSFGTYIFQNCTVLTNVSIPKGISINANNLSGCSSLETLEQEDNGSSANVVVDGVLFNRAKTSILLYPKAKAGPYTIPDGVTNIGTVFNDCINLTELIIPASVTTIGTSADFVAGTNVGTKRLTAINVHDDNNNFKSIDGVLYSKDGKTLIYYPGGKTGTFLMPAEVTTIGVAAFAGVTGLNELVIPAGVKEIGSNAFRQSSIARISFAEGSLIKTISERAFANISNVAQIIIPTGVEAIGKFAFANTAGHPTKLKKVGIPDTVNSLGENAFENCTSLTDVVLPEGVTVGAGLFKECTSLERMRLPNSIKAIGAEFFYNCRNLVEANIPDGVTLIDRFAFQNCNRLTEIDFPYGIVSIAWSAFANTGLTKVNLPASVNSLGMSVFANCSNLAEVNLSPSLTTIITSAFENCTSLESIEIPENVKSISSAAFKGSGLRSIVIPYGVTSIGSLDTDSSGVFINCKNLVSVSIPSSVTTIYGYTFYGCTSLKDINIPDSIRSINQYAFYGCVSLTDLYIPANSVLSIGEYAFANCTGLANLTISTGVESIANFAFANCTSIDSIVLPATVLTLGTDVFSGWTAEQTIYLEEVVAKRFGWDTAWARDCEADIVWDWVEQRA